MAYIYKITNIINNKFYIGKTVKTLQERFNSHLKTAKQFEGLNECDYPYNSRLYPAINKYGAENFKIEPVEECLNDELNEREKYWINKLNSKAMDIGYNIAPGGSGGIVWEEGKHPSLGKGLKGESNGFYGKHHSLETKLLFKEIWKDKMISGYTPFVKGKIRVHKTVDDKDIIKYIEKEELDTYLKNGWYRKVNEYIPKHPEGSWHHTAESKRKISKARKGKKSTPEAIAKYRNTMQNKSEEEKALIKQHRCESHLGKVWVYKDDVSMQINKEFLDKYINEGFLRGRGKLKRRMKHES